MHYISHVQCLNPFCYLKNKILSDLFSQRLFLLTTQVIQQVSASHNTRHNIETFFVFKSFYKIQNVRAATFRNIFHYCLLMRLVFFVFQLSSFRVLLNNLYSDSIVRKLVLGQYYLAIASLSQCPHGRILVHTIFKETLSFKYFSVPMV